MEAWRKYSKARAQWVKVMHSLHVIILFCCSRRVMIERIIQDDIRKTEVKESVKMDMSVTEIVFIMLYVSL